MKVQARLAGLADYFSFGLLLKTLFAPFRQIAAGSVDGPIGVKIRAFFDRLFSRMVGAVVRTIVLCIGVVSLVVTAIGGVFYVLLWGIVPLMPIIGLILMFTRWIPWTIL